MPETANKPKDKRLSDLARLLGVLVFFAALGYLLSRDEVRRVFFDITAMRERLRAYGWYGGFVFIAFAGLFTGVGIPRLWISVLAGGFYGAVLGTVIGHLSSLLGATLNFFIARWFLRGPVIRRMPARLKVWYERFNRRGFKYLLYMRLFPLSNATVTNTVGGVSRMTFPHFIAATFIGYLPLTIVFAIFGSSAAKQNYWQLLIGAAIFVTVLTVEHGLRRRVNAELATEEDRPGE